MKPKNTNTIPQNAYTYVLLYLSFEFPGNSACFSFSSACFETLYRLRSRVLFGLALLLGSTFRPGGFGGNGRDLEDCLERDIHKINYW